jgi:aryl sulfotransferase
MKKDVIELVDSVPDRVGPPLGYAPSSILQYFRDWLTGDGYPWWSYWEHIRSWWQIRNLPNVMLLHFSNLKKDLAGEIQRIAAFLNIAVDENKWNVILEHCSFQYMKAHAAEIVPFGGSLWEGGAETFMNKGANGRWKDVLPREDIERYESLAREKLGEECAYWLSTGMFLNVAKEGENHE